jgi:hypothetical protein
LLAGRRWSRVLIVRAGRIDAARPVTVAGGVALLVYGLSRAAASPTGIALGDALVLASLAAAVVFLVSFVLIDSLFSGKSPDYGDKAG